MPIVPEEKTKAEKAVTKEETDRDKRIKRSCCCIGSLIFFLFILGALFTFRFFASSADSFIPSNLPSTTSNEDSKPTESKTSKTSSSFPAPQDCQAIEAVAANALDISPTSPGLKKEANTTYYKIYGFTKYDIQTQLANCRMTINGERFGGNTNVYTNWTYDYSLAGGKCGTKNVTVGFDSEITLPKWQKPENFQSGVDSIWDDFFNALSGHEYHHRDIAAAGAQKIYDTLLNFETYTSCDALKQATDAFGYQTLDEVSAEQINYDEVTNHGATEGANL